MIQPKIITNGAKIPPLPVLCWACANNIIFCTFFLSLLPEQGHIRLLKMEDSYQLCSAPEYGDQIRKAFEIRKPAKLSQPALEVLTIIAYYQPTTRAYVDQIRGVDSSYTVGLLLDRHLIEECGRLQVPGRPRLYRTTQSFLRAFHLNSLEDLPQMPGLEADGQMRLDDEGNLPAEGE